MTFAISPHDPAEAAPWNGARKRKIALWLALVASPVLAQTHTPAPYPRVDPLPTARAAEPRTPVPAAAYQSSLDGLPSGVEAARTDWPRANAEVGQFKNGHADILKWEANPNRNAAGQAMPIQPDTKKGRQP